VMSSLQLMEGVGVMMRTFCGVLMLALVGPLVGCNGGKSDDDESTGTPMTSNPTTGPTTGPDTPTGGTTIEPTETTADDTTGVPPTDPTTSDPSTTSDDTTGGVGGECDPKAQDCPEGFKCTAYASMLDGTWDANKCVPEPEDGGLQGEPCTVEDNMFTGLDDCAKGYICQFADDDGTNGICVEMCNPDSECPNTDGGNGHCLEIANEGVLPLCLLTCDPLAQDCPGNLACYGIDTYLCYRPDPVDNPGQDGDTCNFINACVAGLSCTDKAVLDGCQGDQYGCCSPFCSLDEMTCTDPEVCTPFFDPPMPGYENVGVCTLP
jgi:hypothetical protein